MKRRENIAKKENKENKIEDVLLNEGWLQHEQICIPLLSMEAILGLLMERDY